MDGQIAPFFFFGCVLCFGWYDEQVRDLKSSMPGPMLAHPFQPSSLLQLAQQGYLRAALLHLESSTSKSYLHTYILHTVGMNNRIRIDAARNCVLLLAPPSSSSSSSSFSKVPPDQMHAGWWIDSDAD